MLEHAKLAALAVWAWVYAHPVIVTWLVGTAVTAALKPRTPEQFAAMPYWKASLLKLAGGLFTDPAKAQQAILAILLRKPLEATFCVKTQSDPNEPHDTDPPAGPAGIPVRLNPTTTILAIAASLMLCVAGCGPMGPDAKSPARDYARAGLSLLAEGTKEAIHVCAEFAKSKVDVGLAKTCADAGDSARASLLAGQAIVDTWESAQQREVLCAAGKGVAALKEIAEAVRAAGGPAMPGLVQDALSLGAQLGAGCQAGGS